MATYKKINGEAVKLSGESGTSTANQISYDNTTSGMIATDVQAAVDELNENLTNIDDRLVNDVGAMSVITWAEQNFQPNTVVVAHYGGNSTDTPSSSAGWMHVFGTNTDYLTIMAYSVDGKVYSRTKNQAWGSWEVLVNASWKSGNRCALGNTENLPSKFNELLFELNDYENDIFTIYVINETLLNSGNNYLPLSYNNGTHLFNFIVKVSNKSTFNLYQAKKDGSDISNAFVDVKYR